MVKLKILFILLFICAQNFGQVSVGPKHTGGSSKFKKGTLEKFKKTTTIFVLSNIYDKTTYENILKESWNVTPYKIVNKEDFNIENYLSDEYSIAQLSGYKRDKTTKSGTIVSSLFTYVIIAMYDNETILKKFDKISEKRKEKKMNEIIRENSEEIASFYIFPKGDFVRTALRQDIDSTVTSLYTDDVFFNYKPGLLKNYFQKINNLIEKEEEYWMYNDDYSLELKKLSTYKLYIPSYIAIKYNPLTRVYSEKDDENIEEVFKKYEFQYEILKDEDLSDKIMNNEDIYYLRYVRMNAERFLQIVSAKSGEILYSNYMTGLSYKLKAKHIADLNSKIKKALKK